MNRWPTDNKGRVYLAPWYETRIGRIVMEWIISAFVLAVLGIMLVLSADTLPVRLP
jgi:hypothetical protein